MPVQPMTKKERTAARKAAPTAAQRLSDFETQLHAALNRVEASDELSDPEKAIFADIAGCAYFFARWTDADPFHARLPAAYSGRLSQCLTWLQGLDGEDALRKARTRVLASLRRTWPAFQALEGEWDALRSIWQTDDEFGPLDDERGKYPLPVYTSTVLADWDCYSGALVFLNQALGLFLLDTTRGDTHDEK